MAGFFARMWTKSANALDNRFHWDRMWRPLGIFTLAGLRNLYREKNLYDTDTTSPTEKVVREKERPENTGTLPSTAATTILVTRRWEASAADSGATFRFEPRTRRKSPTSWSQILV